MKYITIKNVSKLFIISFLISTILITYNNFYNYNKNLNPTELAAYNLCNSITSNQCLKENIDCYKLSNNQEIDICTGKYVKYLGSGQIERLRVDMECKNSLCQIRNF